MLRARDYAIAQYESVARYIQSLGLEKPIHIGETGGRANQMTLRTNWIKGD